MPSPLCGSLGIDLKNTSPYWLLGLWGEILRSYLSYLGHGLGGVELLTTDALEQRQGMN